MPTLAVSTRARERILPSHHWSYPWIAVFAAAVMIARLIAGPITHFNHTIDEPYHLASAVALYSEHAPDPQVTYRPRVWLGAQHPPLARWVMGLPLWIAGVHHDGFEHEYLIVEYQAFEFGHEILLSHQVPYWRMLITARLAMLVFPIAALFFVYRLGRYLINPLAGMLATVMFSIDPTLLGHAPWLGTDVAGCAGFVAGIYFGTRWLARPGWRRSIALGIALGLAIGAKYSCALLVPILMLLAIARILLARDRARMLRRLPAPGKCAGVAAVAFFLLWAIFCFDFAPLRFNAMKFDASRSIYARLPPALRETPVPMPAFWLGNMYLSSRVRGAHPTYLNGTVLPEGSGIYFPEAVLVKSTMGFLAAIAIALFFATRDRRVLRLTIFLVPILLYFGGSITARYQLGIRHLLPIIPLACLLIAMELTRGRRIVVLLIVLVLAAIETARIHPDYLAFFNAASGGPSRGERYLIDSNLDWGQDLWRLADWLNGPEAAGRPYAIQAFNARFDPGAESAYPMSFLRELRLDPQSVKVDPPALRDHPHGLLAISKNVRHRLEGATCKGDGTLVLGPDFSWLEAYPVVKRIGYSIDVYDLDHPLSR